MATMTGRMKKATVIVLIAVGVLLLFAVVLGILNALVAGGRWTFGWNDYRYDESGFEIGSGSIPADRISEIDLDWIDGMVELLPCEDRYLSLTETAEEALPESAELRWRLDESGKLTVKYRKSSWFFGFGASRQKKLVLRVPTRFLEDLTRVDISVDSADVWVHGISAETLRIELKSGALLIEDCTVSDAELKTESGKLKSAELKADRVTLETKYADAELGMVSCPREAFLTSKSGDLTLCLPEDSDFSLLFESTKGAISSDLALSESNGYWVCGDGTAELRVQTESGRLSLAKPSN